VATFTLRRAPEQVIRKAEPKASWIAFERLPAQREFSRPIAAPLSIRPRRSDLGIYTEAWNELENLLPQDRTPIEVVGCAAGSTASWRSGENWNCWRKAARFPPSTIRGSSLPESPLNPAHPHLRCHTSSICESPEKLPRQQADFRKCERTRRIPRAVYEHAIGRERSLQGASEREFDVAVRLDCNT
jgi:hypothetical protein